MAEMDGKKVILSEVLFDANSGKDLLSEEFYVLCFVLRVESRKTSQVLSLLADRLPLLDLGLAHLKRVRKVERSSAYVEILVGPVSALDSIPEDLWSKCGVPAPPSNEQEETELQVSPNQCPEVLTCRVPRFEPSHRQEFTVWSQAWPINFHPGEEERSRNKGHTEEELRYVSHHISRLLEMMTNAAEANSGSSPAVAILTNPQTTAAICTSREAEVRLREQHDGDDVSHHPLLCPTLLAVDQIAAIARKEAPGFERLPQGHYLCTGLDLFLTIEPNLFAAMALVHSRIRRVYFLECDPVFGALKSGNGHLHSLRSLNHHYRVFQVSLEQTDHS